MDTEEITAMTETESEVETKVEKIRRKSALLRKFIEELPRDDSLVTLKTTNAGIFQHRATGAEVNAVTDKIADRLKEQRVAIVRTAREFGTVYDILKQLDCEYLSSVKYTMSLLEEHCKRLDSQQEDIKKGQADIRNVFEAQAEAIDVLSNISQKLEEGFCESKRNTDMLTSELTEQIEALQSENIVIRTQIEREKRKSGIFGIILLADTIAIALMMILKISGVF